MTLNSSTTAVDIVSSERMEKGVNPSWANKYKRSGGVFGVSHFSPLLFVSTTLKIIQNNA